MGPRSIGPEAFHRRLIGLYALTLMERDGPLHGYGLSEEISRRTGGTWRPGPGSVYPSLQKLVELGFAHPRTSGRRREYTITPSGRALLRRVRLRGGLAGRSRPDLSPLWAEVLGSSDVGEFLLRRLHHTLDALEAQLGPGAPIDPSQRDLRRSAIAALHDASSRLSAPFAAPPTRREVAPRAG